MKDNDWYKSAEKERALLKKLKEKMSKRDYSAGRKTILKRRLDMANPEPLEKDQTGRKGIGAITLMTFIAAILVVILVLILTGFINGPEGPQGPRLSWTTGTTRLDWTTRTNGFTGTTR
jgi:hypothetical protein